MSPEDHQQFPLLPSPSLERKSLISLSPETEPLSSPLQTITPPHSQHSIKSVATHRKNASINQGSRFPSRTPRNDRQCTNCGETDTPQWRGTLCNACALWKRSRGTDRPLPLLFPVRKRSFCRVNHVEEDERERGPENLETWAPRNHVAGYGRALPFPSRLLATDGRSTARSQPPSSRKMGMPDKIVSIMTQGHSYPRGRQVNRNIEGGRCEAEDTEVRFPKLTRSSPLFHGGPGEPRTVNLGRDYPTLRYGRYVQSQEFHSSTRTFDSYSGYGCAGGENRSERKSPIPRMSREEFMRGAEWLYDVLQQTSKLLRHMDNIEARVP